MHRASPLPAFDRRTAALACTALVHVLLVLGWQAARRLPSTPPRRDAGTRIRWIALPPFRSTPATLPALPASVASSATAPVRAHSDAPAHVRAHDAGTPAPDAITIVPAIPAPSGATGVPTAPDRDAPAAPSDAAAPGALLQQARRSAGAADRAMRKDGKPTIVAPPDSPMTRLRNGIEAAADAAPTAWYEAPKIDELTSYGGDGGRITRVRSGGVTYCVFTRSPASGIDTIERQGKEKIGNCPKDATPVH